jgi:ankyrin repeat protein
MSKVLKKWSFEEIIFCFENFEKGVSECNLEEITGSKYTMEKYSKKLIQHFIRSNYIKSLEFLLDHSKYINFNSKISDVTPLMYAINLKRKNIIELLLKYKFINVNLMDEKDNTVLHEAIYGEDITIINLLLSRKDIDVNVENDDFESPLSALLYRYMASYEITEIVKKLIKRKDLNINEEIGDEYTPLMKFISDDKEELVKILLEERDDLDINYSNINSETALSISVERYRGDLKDFGDRYIKSKNILKLLLENKDINLNTTNEYGDTILMNAVMENHESIVKILIEYNVDVNFVNEYGFTALKYALFSRNINIINMLLSTLIPDPQRDIELPGRNEIIISDQELNNLLNIVEINEKYLPSTQEKRILDEITEKLEYFKNEVKNFNNNNNNMNIEGCYNCGGNSKYVAPLKKKYNVCSQKCSNILFNKGY